MSLQPASLIIHGPVGDLLVDPWGRIHALLAWLGAGLRTWAPVAMPALTVATCGLILLRRYWRHRCQAALHRHARVVTILAPPTVDPDGAHACWSNLVGLLRPALARLLSGQSHVAFEYLFGHDGVQIRMWVPGPVPPHLVERAVEAAWPAAHTRSTPATAPITLTPAEGFRAVTTGGTLRLARPEALPIRSQFPVDPLRALLGAASGLDTTEHACVQIVARPVTGRRITRAHGAAARVDAGRGTRLVDRILDTLTPGPPSTRTATSVPDQHTRFALSAQHRAMVDKLHGSQFDTLVRYTVTRHLPTATPTAEIRRARAQLRGRAHAIASAFAGFTGHNHYRRTRLRTPLTTLAQRRFGRRGDLLSIPELAAIAHLPTDEALPGLVRAGARAVPAPPGTPTEGPAIKPIGVSDSGHPRPVGLTVSDARHHIHVLGATGAGKSTLLAGMILADADHGRGAVVIDPQGDLITDVLMRLPERLADTVVLVDADSRGPVPCLNPLEGPKNIAVDNLVSVFARVFSTAWGPRTEDILRAACLTLRAAEPSPTLATLPTLLTNPAGGSRYRAAVAHDPVLRGFWDWYDALSDGARAHAVAPLLNKLRALLLRPFVVEAIAAGPSTVDMSRVLDGGLCLVRIPKGSLGEDTTRLVGSLIVSRVWQAALARSALPQRERRDAALYVDEAQNFLHLPYSAEDMLAEARGYRLSMVLAHQHLGQLPRDLREGISTNARTKIYFSCSPEDARELARHTAPRISDHDLAHLARFHAAIRLVVNGEQTPPFTVLTHNLPPAIPGRAHHIRTAVPHNIATPQRHTETPPHRTTSRRHSTPAQTPKPKTTSGPRTS